MEYIYELNPQEFMVKWVSSSMIIKEVSGERTYTIPWREREGDKYIGN